VVQAIREARLEGALAPGAFIKLCQKDRRVFKARHDDIGVLMQIRWDAEDVAEKQQPRLALIHRPNDDF
jgi:hypothetical protein